MNLLVPVLLLALSALCLWKAEPIGRGLKRMDGGRLQRDNYDLGGDGRSYPFFVRMGSLMFAAISLLMLAGQLLNR